MAGLSGAHDHCVFGLVLLRSGCIEDCGRTPPDDLVDLHGCAAKRVRLAIKSATADQLDRWMLRVLCAESAGDDTLD